MESDKVKSLLSPNFKSWLTLLLFFQFLYGTNAQDIDFERLSISVVGGRSIPVGAFGKKNILNSAIYTSEDVLNPWIIGIDKSKSGFAQSGYFYNIQLNYSTNKSIVFLLRSGQTVNRVWTDGISNFLTNNYGDQKFEHVDYKIFYVSSGVDYEITKGNFSVCIGIFSGIAVSNYPYYQSILLYTTTNPPRIWAHEGEQPDLKGFFRGTHLSIDYRKSQKISWKFECAFQRADFDYKMTTRIIPGGNPNAQINDRLKTSLICLGLGIEYKLSSKESINKN